MGQKDTLEDISRKMRTSTTASNSTKKLDKMRSSDLPVSSVRRQAAVR